MLIKKSVSNAKNLETNTLEKNHTYIHTYFNYAIIAWGSAIRTNLEESQHEAKTCNTFIFNKDKYAYTREILKEQKKLYIYMMNILSNITYIHSITRQCSCTFYIFDKNV